MAGTLATGLAIAREGAPSEAGRGWDMLATIPARASDQDGSEKTGGRAALGASGPRTGVAVAASGSEKTTRLAWTVSDSSALGLIASVVDVIGIMFTPQPGGCADDAPWRPTGFPSPAWTAGSAAFGQPGMFLGSFPWLFFSPIVPSGWQELQWPSSG